MNKMWSCQIGEIDDSRLPDEAESTMRAAVAVAYENLIGRDADFIFSGWGHQLGEAERAVVENRLPNPYKLRDELRERLKPIQAEIDLIESNQRSHDAHPA